MIVLCNSPIRFQLLPHREAEFGCSRTAAPRLVMPAVRHARAVGVTSLLDLTERPRANAANAQLAQHLWGHGEQ